MPVKDSNHESVKPAEATAPQYPKQEKAEELTATLERLNVLGDWPHEEELPHAEDYSVWDTWRYRGRLWIRTPGISWEESSRPVDMAKETPRVPGGPRILGHVNREDDLPPAADYEPNDAWVWRSQVWVLTSQGEWRSIQDAEPVSGYAFNDELNRLLRQATPPEHKPTGQETQSTTDAGSMARELLEHKAELRRLRIARIKYRCFFWGMILMIVTAAVLAVYGYIQRDLKSGRYSDFRECRIMVGDLAITGKRTYSYPFKSLWGNRWVDESKVEEVTTINLPGSKLAIVIDAEPKWIGYRFTDGERGTQILKAGAKYTFVTDKGMAMASYGGFCQAVDKQQSLQDDPKNPERTIIK